MAYLIVDTSKYNDLLQGRDLIKQLLGSTAAPTQKPTAPAQDATAQHIAASTPAAVAHPLLQGPRLQLDVLRVLAAHPTGTMNSYEVAKALGMPQPVYAKKIRGTGRAPNQVQDVLYYRGWAYPNGPQSRVRRYDITPEGRQVAALPPIP